MDRTKIVRVTSIRAYKNLVVSGQLNKQKKAIWEWLFNNGPHTRNEIAVGLWKTMRIRIQPNDCSSRLCLLKKMGNVREVGSDFCQVVKSKNEITLYDVTGQAYAGVAPKKSKKKPKVEEIRTCGECPLVVLDEDEDEVCKLDQAILVMEDGRPAECKLCERDVVLRGA